MNFKRLFCAGMAGVMFANTSVFCASADKIPTDDPRYYNWSYPEDYEDQPHINGYFSYNISGKGLVAVHFTAEEGEGTPEEHGYDEYYDERELGYEYKLQVKVGGKWKNVYSGKGDDYSADADNLKAYTTYSVRIYIPHYGDYWYNKDGHKAYSEVIKVRTPPDKTKITSASSTKTSVRLSWKKVKCQGYKIQRNMGGNLWKTVKTVRNSNTTTARISKLRPGKKYRFRVRAYGRTLKQFPVTKIGEGIDDENYLTHNLWGKASKVVTIKTKK